MTSKATRPLGLKIILGVLGVELSVLIAIVVTYVVATLAGEVRSLPTMLALAALGLVLAVWLAFVVKALASGRRWARNGAIFWQLVQLTVAWGSFTGEFANPLIGVGLILPSLTVIVLLFEKSVFAATQGEIPGD
jgi:drug/metabolite transporter superfamily protein YnfA